MAENISKVIYGGRTLIDLTSDTVVPDKMLRGYTAHDATGATITGTCDFDADTQDATAADSEILSGKTAYVKGAKKTGIMKNNAGVSLDIAKVNEPVIIPIGYHDGSGTAQIAASEQAKLVSNNIREGVTILGVLGTMSGMEGAKAQAKTVTPSTSPQEVLPDDGYNYLSEVTVNPIPYTESTNSAGGLTATIA